MKIFIWYLFTPGRQKQLSLYFSQSLWISLPLFSSLYVHTINKNSHEGFNSILLHLDFVTMEITCLFYFYFKPFWWLRFPSKVEATLFFSAFLCAIYHLPETTSTDLETPLTHCVRLHCLLIKVSTHAWKISTESWKRRVIQSSSWACTDQPDKTQPVSASIIQMLLELWQVGSNWIHCHTHTPPE